MATNGTYYFDTASFDNATTLYTDVALTLIANNGWYSNDAIVRQQVSGVLFASQACSGGVPTPTPSPVAPTPPPAVPNPVAPTPVTPNPPTPNTPNPPTPVAPTPVAPTPVAPTPVAPTPVAPSPPTPTYTTLLYRDDGSGSGWNSSSVACSSSGSIAVVNASYGSTFSVGTYLFTNTALTIPFNGNNRWFLDEPRNNALFIDASGQITLAASCAAPTPVAPSPPTPVAPIVYAYTLRQCTTLQLYDVTLPQSTQLGTSVSYAGQCWEVYAVASSGAAISPQSYPTNCTDCLNPPAPPSPPSPPTPVAPSPPVGNCYQIYLQRGFQLCSGSFATYSFNATTLSSATAVYSDSSCTTLMSGTYYFTQNNQWKLWTGSQFVQSGSC
jgi:hypothetical protein